MRKKLAIKGHPTRGKEAIELLEMMGGVNADLHKGNFPDEWKSSYYIYGDNTIQFARDEFLLKLNFVIFTLEEFLEKYPFKVGDKVNQPCRGCVKTITSMEWDEYLETVSYKLDNKIYTRIEQLKVVNDLPYKETNMKPNKCTYCVYAVNNNHCGLRGFRSNFNVNYCSAQNVDKLPNGFELQEDGYFSWVNKKPKYPTTYAECCEVLVGRKPKPHEISFDKMELCLVDLDNTQSIDFQTPQLFQLNDLFKLLMCRKTYWKIAGEEMSLGRPWDSVYGCGEWGYWIGYDINANKIYCQDSRILLNHLLVFPSEEMRDAFYDNFKDLIEKCKELL